MNPMPSLRMLLDEPFGKFGYSTENGCFFHFWKGYLTLEEVKKVAELTNRVMAEHGLTNVLADHRHMEMFSDEVADYIARVWIPAQERLGARGTFIVMSPEAFTQLAAEEMHEQARETSAIEIFHFDALEDALRAVEVFNRKQMQAA